MMWMNGMYTLNAIEVVASEILSKNGQAEKYRDTPIVRQMRENNRELTEEEKQEQIQQLFSNLSIMQGNFERTHGE